MSVSVLLLVAAIVCFVLAALSVGGAPFVPIGLALFAAAHLPV